MKKKQFTKSDIEKARLAAEIKYGKPLIKEPRLSIGNKLLKEEILRRKRFEIYKK